MFIISITISKFITESPVEHITAASVIYKIMEVNSTIVKEELFQLLMNIINNIKMKLVKLSTFI